MSWKQYAWIAAGIVVINIGYEVIVSGYVWAGVVIGLLGLALVYRGVRRRSGRRGERKGPSSRN